MSVRLVTVALIAVLTTPTAWSCDCVFGPMEAVPNDATDVPTTARIFVEYNFVVLGLVKDSASGNVCSWATFNAKQRVTAAGNTAGPSISSSCGERGIRQENMPVKHEYVE